MLSCMEFTTEETINPIARKARHPRHANRKNDSMFEGSFMA